MQFIQANFSSRWWPLIRYLVIFWMCNCLCRKERPQNPFFYSYRKQWISQQDNNYWFRLWYIDIRTTKTIGCVRHRHKKEVYIICIKMFLPLYLFSRILWAVAILHILMAWYCEKIIKIIRFSSCNIHTLKMLPTDVNFLLLYFLILRYLIF